MHALRPSAVLVSADSTLSLRGLDGTGLLWIELSSDLVFIYTCVGALRDMDASSYSVQVRLCLELSSTLHSHSHDSHRPIATFSTSEPCCNTPWI